MDTPSLGGDAAPGRPRDELDVSELDAVLAGQPRRRRRRLPPPPPPSTPPELRSTATTPARPRRAVTAERRAVDGLALLAAVASMAAPVSPTGLGVADVVLRAGFAAVVTYAASRARRSTWIVLAAGSTLLAPHGVWFASAAIALAIAIAAAFLPRRRLLGAVVAALAVPALLRAHTFWFSGASALYVWAVVAPVLVSGYRVTSRRSRERVHQFAAAGILVALVGLVFFALASWVAYHDLSSGSSNAEQGLADLRGGHGTKAAVELSNASTALGSANDVLAGWWMAPARVVPFVSQQLDALTTATGQGRDVSAAAATVASKADYHELRYVQGQIDVAHLRQLHHPLVVANAALAHAEGRIDGVRSPWLIGPVRGALDRVSRQIHATVPQGQVAQQAVEVAPGMLGGNGVRHYFVAFTTEAESRGLGGFMGNWAELTASNGKLTMTRSGRVDELNRYPDEKGRQVTRPADYVNNWGPYQVGTYVQDVTLSPDLPSVARVLGDLYPHMGGDHLDGVLVVDPYGLAALLNFTGPINVDGAPLLTAKNAATELVQDQYTDFTEKTDRVDFLDQASKLTFEKLTTGSIPGPDEIASVLGPAVGDRHLMFSSFRGDEQALFRRLGATGAFPAPKPGRDFFELTGQNGANNKTDIWMHRSIDYDATYDPRTGAVKADVKVTLRNDAPTSGYPPGVIGTNGRGLPPGTNKTLLSFYTPLDLVGAQVDGSNQAFQTQLELGYHAFRHYVVVPAHATVVVQLELSGTIAGGAQYHLGFGVQPMVNSDQVAMSVAVAKGWQIAASKGLLPDGEGTKASLSAAPTREIDAEIRLQRGP